VERLATTTLQTLGLSTLTVLGVSQGNARRHLVVANTAVVYRCLVVEIAACHAAELSTDVVYHWLVDNPRFRYDVTGFGVRQAE